VVALLAETGHRLGVRVAMSPTLQVRQFAGRPLGDRLEPAERSAFVGGIAPGDVEALEAVDVVWYAPGRFAFLFEVEWTAILGPLLARHERIPPDDRVVRFLVVPPERAPLIGAKAARSAVVASAFEAGNWHVLKWNHLRSFAALERPSLERLEPFLGVDPPIERTGEQAPPFERSPTADRDGDPPGTDRDHAREQGSRHRSTGARVGPAPRHAG
jgi:hypothetical protein